MESREVRALVALLGPCRTPLPRYDAAPGPDDARCDEVARRLVDGGREVIAGTASAVTKRQAALLYRCSVRAVAQAMAAPDRDLCRRGLVLALLTVHDEKDPRDPMVGLAPHHVAAASVDGDARALFGWAADHCPSAHADLVRSFGARTDVTPADFGWALVATGTGTWFQVSGWGGDRAETGFRRGHPPPWSASAVVSLPRRHPRTRAFSGSYSGLSDTSTGYRRPATSTS